MGSASFQDNRHFGRTLTQPCMLLIVKSSVIFSLLLDNRHLSWTQINRYHPFLSSIPRTTAILVGLQIPHSLRSWTTTILVGPELRCGICPSFLNNGREKVEERCTGQQGLITVVLETK